MVKIITNVYIFVSVIIVSVILYICITAISVYKINNDRETTRNAMLKIQHDCPEGCREIVEPWGGDKSGYSRYCIDRFNNKQGQWVAWANSKLQIEGFYYNNAKHGIWKWFNNDGTVNSSTEYVLGKEVKETKLGK